MTSSAFEVPQHASLSPPWKETCWSVASIDPCGDVVAPWSKPAEGITPADRPAHARHRALAPAGPIAANQRPGSWVSVGPAAPRRQGPSGRCTVSVAPGGPRPEPVVYDAEGRAIANEVLGDDVKHVFTTAAGHFWGVWAHPFLAGLETRPRFPDDGGDVPEISDCYPVNVGDDEVWTCYYTDVPIVRSPAAHPGPGATTS